MVKTKTANGQDQGQDLKNGLITGIKTKTGLKTFITDRHHAVASVVIVAFPISICLSKFAVVVVQNYVDKSMSPIGI